MSRRTLNIQNLERPSYLSLQGPPLKGPPLKGAPLKGAPLQGPPLKGAPLQGPPLKGTAHAYRMRAQGPAAGAMDLDFKKEGMTWGDMRMALGD